MRHPLAEPVMTVPVHVAVALSQIGVVEWPGQKESNPIIEAYHGMTRAGESPDHVPWCSSFLCWVMEMSGIPSTKSKSASSWRTWGNPCDPSQLGAVIFLGKKDPDAGGTGHVGISLGISGKTLFLLGGNQADRVDIGTRPVSRITAARYPALLTA